MNYSPAEATDYRRATAVLTHWREQSPHGVVAVLHETDDDPREDAALGLVLALADLALACSPSLRSDDGADMLRATVARLAGLEE